MLSSASLGDTYTWDERLSTHSEQLSLGVRVLG